MALDHSTSIIIIGAGTWGCSTALHLARRGYKNVTVFDPFPVPSPISAGNDVNKIITARSSSFADDSDDEAYVARKLLEASMEGWLHDPVFKSHYHETGFIAAASSPANIAKLQQQAQGDKMSKFKYLDTPEDFRKTMPEGVLTGDFPNWHGWHKKTGAGWVHARDALISAAAEAKRLGVTFIPGSPEGHVTSLLYEQGDIKGAKTADGKEHRADRTILCAGASAVELLDFKDQLRPTAWTLAHIKMTPEEAALYKNLPVLFNVERGFFMEPDADNHELKMCDEHPGYCNWVNSPADGKRKSLPFARNQIPVEAEQRCRNFLRETMPQLADRPFSFARICWCADTPNRSFLIDRHPEYPSLVLGVGGSGHGFSCIPAIGGFIVDAMEGTLDPKMAKSYRWRPETAVNRDWNDTQGRSGATNEVMDFQKVTQWTAIGSESKL
ncbi:hypothetical protein H2201_007410 [Coniosporium apollinis]|uniref:FAD dependent oxidoreductase domain-containing protein n=1 Tax=Coniosporium apollinis TaxID=61459 RepID=A0ABQ9NJR2_9PEZI|nr:hypothetical protein H2201_007410 [Coniosporium apollinis]